MSSYANDSTQVDCEKCRCIQSALLAPLAHHSKHRIPLGSVQEYFHGSCPLHIYLLEPLLAICSNLKLNVQPTTTLHVQSSGSSSMRMLLAPGSMIPMGIHLDFDQVIGKHSVDQSRVRVLNEWIDLNVLQGWRDNCNALHSKCKSNAFSSMAPDAIPYLLIDTHKMCLKRSNTGDRYLALSYVWGQSLMLKTLADNFEQHQEEGIFQRQEIASLIPPTVRDAIHFTKHMGERYLWVDALCIIQDDAEIRTRELNGMAAIYANAQFTIIAANGPDANHGLRGFKYSPDSRPREYTAPVISLPTGESMVYREKRIELDKQMWNQRGWTFQEDLFTARKMIFIDHEVHWQCLCEHWDEHSDDKLRSNRLEKAQDIQASFEDSWPDLAQYIEIVHIYRKRKFTFPEDIHAAFVGATAAFSTTSLGPFNYGCPELFFDAALLWDLTTASRTHLRRKSSDPKKYLPSWSWMGWENPISFLSWTELHPVHRSKPEAHYSTSWWSFTTWSKLLPLVQWYSVYPSTGYQRKINSHWDKLGHVNVAANLPSPEGWTRHVEIVENQPLRVSSEQELTIKPLPVGSEQGPTIEWYTNIHLPDIVFAYPIPLKQEYDLLPTTPPESSHIIWCRTQRCWLFGGGPKNSDWPKNLLCDVHGVEAGHMSSFPGGDSRKCIGEKYELVAISLLETAWGSSMHEYGHYQLPQWFYNVLSIEWIDGIAYRTGLGIVKKEVWEAQELEWIDLTLG